MTILEPVGFELIFSSAKDESYEEWSLNKSVIADSFYTYKNRVYKAASTFNADKLPDVDVRFVDFGATNKYKFVDEFINTQTENNGSLDIVVKPKDNVDIATFLGLEGENLIIENSIAPLYFRKSRNWWEYFYAATKYLRTISLPVDTRTQDLSFSITPINGFARLGMLMLGKRRYIGQTLSGAKSGLVDYSRVTKDAWGNATIIPGKTAKTAECSVVIETQDIDYIRDLISKLAGIPTVYLLDDNINKNIGAFTVYGMLKDFSISTVSQEKSELNLLIEGLI
ncbi:hypothetical protein [Campylobacter fetus]|uniref:hypothetical protein n=2 Tax=Campylobacter fetus TaxID=196 RepID=UPI0001BCE2BF|nr:hypothetical protein [Campylobacter fetus]OCS22089.1 hypothetical protein CFVI97532_05980 [Campylobacter fetus subsp. venerealis cfvi97/532]OCS40259.1 hypothetical protein CFVI02298_08605 [Campylobacter fetus subsp. venerealis cfvi02/298]AHE94360.1 hypothetical protein CFVI03293_1052 [Campylobacter fetus subsp. venerealis cfvi03/293]KAA3684603.1 hypothetical protein E3U42_09730 [Campylobacter fetus subsp. fetus]KAA3684676.1 hypothetical protein E3U40_05485 [Campylobacter fetus subsp. venere